MFKLYNQLTKNKEVFASINPKEVSLYVCGITPYDTTHLGHAFTYISIDILVRFLKYKGYEVNYTQNVTDINDRDNDILKRALEQNTPWRKLCTYWTGKFLEDMKKLNWVTPNNYLKASENTDAMTGLIEKLLSNGYAYEKNKSIYFDISKKKDFGKLSRLSSNEMLKIANDFEEDIENSDKKNPLDITLWRATSQNQPAHIPSFDSPFGKGRPGWHIECSAMAIKSLGEQIDIHGGGTDLIYPHHEAEVAQSEGATGKIPFAKFWMHTATVSYQGKKMSKSLGNLIMVSNLLKKYSPNVIRWYLISHHYRQPWEFFEKDLISAQKKVFLIEKTLHLKCKNKNRVNNEYFSDFERIMDDDLNTPEALELAMSLIKKPAERPTLKKVLDVLGFDYEF